MSRGRGVLVGSLALLAIACGSSGDDAGAGGAAGVGGGAGADAGAGGDSAAESGTDSGADSGAEADSDGGAGGGDGGGAAHWVSGYWVGYQSQTYPPSAIAFPYLTHVMVGRVVPKADGSLDTTFDIDATNGPAAALQVVIAAHVNAKKAIAMLGGAGEHAGWVGAASAAHRTAFVQNLVKLADDYGFDGFDLDWEPLDPADEPDAKALVQELRAALPNALLTMPVGWVNANFPQVSSFYADVQGDLDQINLMTYGMAGAWGGWQSWHSAALDGAGGSTPSSIASSVAAYTSAGVAAAKLGLGIGFYGQCWSPPVSGPNQDLGGATVLADDNVMSYANILSSYYTASARTFDATAQVPYLGFASAKGPQGCTFVSYDDEESIAAKGAWAKGHGLGGTIVWTIGEGYVASNPQGQRDPLLEATAKAFLP